jgi:hypothetical protein
LALAAAGHGSVFLLKVGGRHRGGSRGGA